MRVPVAPFTGAWIETVSETDIYPDAPKSHPLRVRGLKHDLDSGIGNAEVAPFTGAWIETGNLSVYKNGLRVAPFTGAWIETVISTPTP